MSSAAKTLHLLDYFTAERPEIGLTQMCRLAGRDKSTTYRHLQSLEGAGFVEQNPMTKNYRLGPKLLQLAQTREITVPRSAGVDGPLHDLADATGETSHVTVLSGQTLYKLRAVESPRHSIRVIMDVDTFPLHATSSGHCALAFSAAELFDLAVQNMIAFTAATVTSANQLRARIEATQATGFARATGSFEDDVHSLAAPLFDQTGLFAGAVSTASVASRFTPDLERTIKKNLITASRAITRNWGGAVPASVEAAWADALAEPKDLEHSA
mmetsp:Transcript_7076/g.11496  ORF Transcript_7076/g.11496 Transcript_7076/m.11496 type:complete len:270 (-) Transcript_7076:1291-2100(-)